MIGSEITRLSSQSVAGAPETLQVDVIADMACPWSYLGKRRLDVALAAVHGPRAVSWYPYQVNPDMPENGMCFDDYLAQKFGDPATMQPALAQLTAAGEEEGIQFRFEKISRVPNTLNAHRAMNFAQVQGGDTSLLADRILNAFFSQGLDIGDPDVLAEIGAELGLGRYALLAALDDKKTKDIVLSQEAQVRQSGVVGVPDFLVNKRLFVVGAQQTDKLVSVFDRAMFGAESELPALTTLH